ncbi:amidohydrolase family protein [Chitinasiproducens palmae]|uniref:Predicted metal-dependent hydrolase, TIM-barrel fold n=1 Tax=Chitinasiproducens palmae TaxID=1770053 RepID=A0A1H2PX30_9BURK|nr:amidohydrolase family protein [Chitinasiproducens palmae]SDV51534.1 Predicted metal-dependent hydrolase, TIM-barrel fold [Chitinasiproducens palmae]
MFDPNYERSNFPRVRPAWLALSEESALEPELAVIDPHHHLWDVESARYRAADLVADAAAGHRVLATVFVECKAHFDATAPAAFQPVGETRFAVEEGRIAAACRGGHDGLVKGIVAYGDPDAPHAREVLAAHAAAGQGRLRGVRVRAAWHADPTFSAPADGPTEATIRSAALDRYCELLTELGLVLDLWVYHTQLDDAAALAARHPGLRIVLDHCGGPLGIGPYRTQHAQVRAAWSTALARVAAEPNVVVKIGGLAMPRTGLGFADQPSPPTGAALAERWLPYVRTCIDLFGPQRCMFESNFPVDKGSASYVAVWNAFKLSCAGDPADDRRAMLAGTAQRIYALDVTGPGEVAVS